MTARVIGTIFGQNTKKKTSLIPFFDRTLQQVKKYEIYAVRFDNSICFVHTNNLRIATGVKLVHILLPYRGPPSTYCCASFKWFILEIDANFIENKKGFKKKLKILC